MPKYLFRANLTAEGMKGTLAEGGTSRRDTLKKLAEGLGGQLEGFYYAFGDTDAYVILDLPDNVTAGAVATTVGESGTVSVSTTVLIEPEEMDQIAAKKVDYRPPGA